MRQLGEVDRLCVAKIFHIGVSYSMSMGSTLMRGGILRKPWRESGRVKLQLR
jgi:hypothetical protein